MTYYISQKGFLLLAATLTILLTPIHCQQCLSFDPSAAPGSGEVCPPYLSSLVWLPLIPDAIRLVDSVLNSTYLWQIKAVQSILPKDCYDPLLSLLCNAAFPPCNLTAGGAALSYPACRSACMHVNDVCSFYFNLYGQTPLNCSQIDVITLEDQWPLDYHDNNIFGLVHINTTCFKELPRSNTTTSKKTDCPYPLHPVDHVRDSKPACYIPCPDPTWTPKQWRDIGIIEFSFGLLSVILMAFISIHYIADPNCRKTTRRFQLYSYISQLLFSFAFVVGGPFPASTTWCADSTTFADVRSPKCGTQAFLFVVFGLTSSIWWAISSSIMYTQLQTRQYRISGRRELLYCAIAFGVPLIPFIVASTLGVVSFYWLTPFCFIQYMIPDSTLDYHYIMFYIPLCVPMLIAMGFILATIYKIVQHTRDMGITFKGEKLSGGVNLIKVNIRLFIWCACLFVFFATILIYRSILEREWALIENDAYAWGVCKVKYQLGIGSSLECPESKFPHPLNYPVTIVHYVITTSLGTLSFLSFGTSKNIYYFWRYVVQLVYKRNWPELRELLTNEKAFAAMRLREIRNSLRAQESLESPTPSENRDKPSGMTVELVDREMSLNRLDLNGSYVTN